ncbi:MAG: response regulator transcription factor [Crocinitomicaceae bacterium]
MYRILLLEDDPSFGYILREYLGMQSFQVTWVKSGEEAILEMNKGAFELAILDIMLPGIDGYAVAEQINRQYPSLPFIFLSAKSLKIDALKGFKVGAFDFITKPVEEEILVAKIHALMNRLTPKKEIVLTVEIGAYTFHPQLSKLYFEQEEIKMTSRESDLLWLLCEHKNQLLPRKKALRELWESTDEFSRKSMDVFISHLRKYLSYDQEVIIENVHGKGFILRCP